MMLRNNEENDDHDVDNETRFEQINSTKVRVVITFSLQYIHHLNKLLINFLQDEDEEEEENK